MKHQVLWQLYHETGDLSARDRLVQESIGLVHHIARKICRTSGAVHDLDDLVGVGSVGLLQAVSSFDPSRGFAFSTYAAQRIRGAIIDEMRARDPLSRDARSKCRRLVQAEREVERREGRAPAAAEIAAELEVDVETYWRWKSWQEADSSTAIDTELPANLGIAEGFARPSDLEEAHEREERMAVVAEALLKLNDQERAVLTLHYFEELKLRDIAAVLEVSESRISQIRSKALRKLRMEMSPVPAEA